MGPKAGRKTPELEKPNPDLGRGGEARLRQGFFLISSDVQDDALASLVDECKLHKRAVSQRPDTELVFKGLVVAKRNCRRDSIGDSFLQRRPRAGHPGAAPGWDAAPPQPRPGWKAQLR